MKRINIEQYLKKQCITVNIKNKWFKKKEIKFEFFSFLQIKNEAYVCEAVSNALINNNASSVNKNHPLLPNKQRKTAKNDGLQLVWLSILFVMFLLH